MKALQRIVLGLGVLAILAGLWLLGGNAYARYRERQVERAWARSFGTREELIKRYPPTTMNDTNRELARLAKRLGLDLMAKSPDAPGNTAVSTGRPGDEFSEGRHSVSEFLGTQLRKPEAAVAPAPPRAKAFLAAHNADLRTIEEELLGTEPPRWDYDAGSKSYVRPQPIPDMSALIALQRILLGRALAAYADGDDGAARRSLEASWKLNQELRCIPDSLCQIGARGAASWQLGVIRKISVDANEWRTRLFEHDYKQSQLDSELFYSWPSAEKFRVFEDLEGRSETDSWKRLRDRFLRPYEDLTWWQFTEGTLRDLVEIREARVVPDLIEHRAKWYSASDVLLSISLPGTRSLFRRVDEYLLDAELTDKVLEARELRLQNSNKWPEAISGIEATRIPNARWLYSVSPEGVMSLQLSQQPYKGRGDFQLPLCFRSS